MSRIVVFVDEEGNKTTCVVIGGPLTPWEQPEWYLRPDAPDPDRERHEDALDQQGKELRR